MANKTKYHKKYCQMLIDHGRKGFSFQSFGAEIGIPRQTMYEWVKKHSEFAEAKTIGESYALRYLEKLAIAKMSGQQVSGFDPRLSETSLIIFFLKTRFHKVYGEPKQNDDDKTISSVEQAIREAKERQNNQGE